MNMGATANMAVTIFFTEDVLALEVEAHEEVIQGYASTLTLPTA
jgi:hypothetical protein